MVGFITGLMSIDTFVILSFVGLMVSIILCGAALESGEGPTAGVCLLFALIIVVMVMVTPSWQEWRVMTYEHAVARLSHERANCIAEGRSEMYCSAHLVKYIADSTEAWDEIRKSGLDTLRRNK